MLSDLSSEWIRPNEGGDTWSVFDVVGHLVHGEKTDWTERTKIILSDSEEKTFTPFDRFAQLRENEDRTLRSLLEEFKLLRSRNIEFIRSLNIGSSELTSEGMHPALGKVNLSQLLSTWVVHDLNHIGQIARIMAKQYKEEVGPWKEYLRILSE